MNNDIIVLTKAEKKKNTSVVENIGKVGMEIGSKLGNVVTEFFVGKPISKEEKELNVIRKERKLKLKLIQEDAQYEKDLELAMRGEYVPPAPVAKDVKKTSITGVFGNIGKYNPLKDFEQTKSIGTTDFGIGGVVNNGGSIRQPDFGLDGFAGSVNPMETNKKKRE